MGKCLRVLFRRDHFMFFVWSEKLGGKARGVYYVWVHPRRTIIGIAFVRLWRFLFFTLK